ncbi:hypothetical protein FDECE_11657 [Fusarium decemcellulare]|nr:hypothetical protein FDECE_11657 [Fusarium decemcellulare]
MGSEENKREPNIWPPEQVYPGFRNFLVRFYWELNKTSLAILDALIMSLDLTEDEAKTVRALHPGHDHQLRLLHYPPMDEATAADKYSARIGAHRDWSSFTILFQDANGGLKYFDRPSETFRDAIPKEGVLYMNIGDMFERVSNGECASLLVETIVSNTAFHRGVYPSALHEVVVRNPGQARYSIPYFFSPIGEGIIEPQPSLVEKVESRLFDPVSMMEYSKTMFERINVNQQRLPKPSTPSRPRSAMVQLQSSPGSSMLAPPSDPYELSSPSAGIKRKWDPSISAPPSSFLSVTSDDEDDDDEPNWGPGGLPRFPQSISRPHVPPFPKRIQGPPDVDAMLQEAQFNRPPEMQFAAEVEHETRRAVDDEMRRHRQSRQQHGPEPSLCPEQVRLLGLIASGRNVFYTGSAGCGKSTVLKAAVRMLRDDMGRKVHILAPTGRAALQVDGMSTWSYMGWTPDYHKKPLAELVEAGFRKFVKQRWRQTDVLIIDEISMVENHHLERINASLKAVRSWHDRANAPAFGGVQLIVTGDFCQLPPVKPFQFCMYCGLEMIPDDDEAEFNCPQNHGPFAETDKWAFKSRAWEEAKFEHVHLRQIHRQNDEYFIKLLQKCRLGLSFAPDETRTLMDHPCEVAKATRLFCTRREVTHLNTLNFNKLKTPIFEYGALDDFNWNRQQHPHLYYYNDREHDGTLKQCKDQRLDSKVQLRGGMLVVLQVNLDIKGGLVNGSQGIICGFEPWDPALLPKAKTQDDNIPPWQALTGEHAKLRETQIALFMNRQPVKAWPKVLFHNGKKRTIYASCVVNSIGDREPYSLLHRTQIPLVAGWAMSVHKSQGMTLDRVIVNLSRAFEEGQVYVALSRATSLEGLKIEGGSEGLSMVSGGNPEVQHFLEAKFGEGLFADCARPRSDYSRSPSPPSSPQPTSDDPSIIDLTTPEPEAAK